MITDKLLLCAKLKNEHNSRGSLMPIRATWISLQFYALLLLISSLLSASAVILYLTNKTL